jgi:hypothetical protein
MDAWRTPGRIGKTHLPYEVSDCVGHTGAALPKATFHAQ